MSVTLYESKYHDSGFYPDTLMKIQKVDDTGRPLAGALFTVRNGEGEPLSFAYREGEGYYLQGYESPAPSETPDGTGADQYTTELRVDDNGKLNIFFLWALPMIYGCCSRSPGRWIRFVFAALLL